MRSWIEIHTNRNIDLYNSEGVLSTDSNNTFNQGGNYYALQGAYFMSDSSKVYLIGNDGNDNFQYTFKNMTTVDDCGSHSGIYKVGNWHQMSTDISSNSVVNVAYIERKHNSKCWTICTRISTHQTTLPMICGQNTSFNATIIPEQLYGYWYPKDEAFVCDNPVKMRVDPNSFRVVSGSKSLKSVVTLSQQKIAFVNEDLIPKIVDTYSDEKNVYITVKSTSGTGMCLFTSSHTIFRSTMKEIKDTSLILIFPMIIKSFDGWDTAKVTCALTSSQMDYKVSVKNYNPDINVDSIKQDDIRIGSESRGFWGKIKSAFTEPYQIFKEGLSNLYIYVIFAVLVYILVVCLILFVSYKIVMRLLRAYNTRYKVVTDSQSIKTVGTTIPLQSSTNRNSNLQRVGLRNRYTN